MNTSLDLRWFGSDNPVVVKRAENSLMAKVKVGWVPKMPLTNEDCGPYTRQQCFAFQKRLYTHGQQLIAKAEREKANRVGPKKILNQQKVLNAKYNALLKQYQKLLNDYIRLKNQNAQDVAQLNRLKNETRRIRTILEGQGLL